MTHSSCIVVPTYNEADNIPHLFKSLGSQDFSWVIIVDDSSPDNTAAVVRQAQEHDPRIHLIVRQGKRSFAKAYCEGLALALELGAEKIVQMDADGSHSPDVLPHILETLDQYDLVIGSRYMPGGTITQWSVWRRIVSRVANSFASTICGLDVHDVTAGYLGWRASVLSKIHLADNIADGYVFLVWLKYQARRLDCSTIEVPITFVDRKYGQSKLHVGMIFESIYQIIRMRLRGR